LLDELLKALYPDFDKDQVRQLLQDAANSRHTRAEKAKRTTLQIVQQLLLWIELDLQPPTSEHGYVSEWAMVFNIQFFDTSILPSQVPRLKSFLQSNSILILLSFRVSVS